MTDNMAVWNNLKRPPKEALKTIKAGRLKGMSDINPQWRYEAMTREFGACGVGWKYEIERVWSEEGSDGQMFAFAIISLYTLGKISWNDPIPGIGGSMLVTKESKGLHASDEGYKMAVTDALSVAMKALGVAADIYAGRWDGSKYKDEPAKPKEKPELLPPPDGNTAEWGRAVEAYVRDGDLDSVLKHRRISDETMRLIKQDAGE